ncbi:unnamed protein product, partial [Owenia fusiformis]
YTVEFVKSTSSMALVSLRRCLGAVLKNGAAMVQTRSYSAASGYLKVTTENDIATIAMDKKPVNSLNLEFLTELSLTLEKLENEKCKGLILTSALPKIFSAGLDILEMYQPKEERLRQFWSTLQDVWLRLYGSPLVTIAAISGHSPAGGCLLSLSCDYRIMADNYTIGLNETKLGIVAPFWFVDTMHNVVGHRQTEMALQLGTMFSSQEALSIGLVDRVVGEGETVDAAKKEMSQWVKIPGYARQLSKMQLRKPTIDKLVARKEDDINYFATFITKDGVQKAMGMYLESLKKK